MAEATGIKVYSKVVFKTEQCGAHSTDLSVRR